jgi:hypothetical protein
MPGLMKVSLKKGGVSLFYTEAAALWDTGKAFTNSTDPS